MRSARMIPPSCNVCAGLGGRRLRSQGKVHETHCPCLADNHAKRAVLDKANDTWNRSDINVLVAEMKLADMAACSMPRSSGESKRRTTSWLKRRPWPTGDRGAESERYLLAPSVIPSLLTYGVARSLLGIALLPPALRPRLLVALTDTPPSRRALTRGRSDACPAHPADRPVAPRLCVSE